MEKEFTVTIREVREKQITLHAVTADEAADAIEYLYSEGNFVLDNDDISDVEFVCQEDILEEGE